MQRREQQRMHQGSSARANQSSSFSGNTYSGNVSGYAPIARQENYTMERDSRYVARARVKLHPLTVRPARSKSPAAPVKPTFKGAGMKLGKKGKQSDFLAAVEDVPASSRLEAQDTRPEPASMPPAHADGGSVAESHEWVGVSHRSSHHHN